MDIHYFQSPGFLIHRLNREELKPIFDEIEQIKNGAPRKDMREDLAGNVATELELVDCRSHIERISIECAYRFNQQTNFSMSTSRVNTVDTSITLSKLWVNFQRKHEFNPVHDHSGLFSFVIWLKVPYTYEQENKNNLSNNAVKGVFQFYYTDAFGRIRNHCINVDKSYEGTLCLFPSILNHSVMPFYSSDEERITVSGNLTLDNRNTNGAFHEER